MFFCLEFNRLSRGTSAADFTCSVVAQDADARAVGAQTAVVLEIGRAAVARPGGHGIFVGEIVVVPRTVPRDGGAVVRQAAHVAVVIVAEDADAVSVGAEATVV